MIEAGKGVSNQIREFVLRTYAERARAEGRKSFKVKVGDVGRAMRLGNRIPQVISALTARKFWELNGLTLLSVEAPSSAPSGQSTSVVITFGVVGTGGIPAPSSGPAPSTSLFRLLRDLAGSAKDVYRKLGGPEKALEDERSGYAP